MLSANEKASATRWLLVYLVGDASFELATPAV
jgi:hypothetical protein